MSKEGINGLIKLHWVRTQFHIFRKREDTARDIFTTYICPC
jgi:hypothetical protein